MNIRIATTAADIAACFPVMRELRPHLAADEFLRRVRHQENAGYRLAFVTATDGVVAVAGFRVRENLANGRFLYVDDLVTGAAHRSQGHGSRLLSWLKAYATTVACGQLHLDSGLQRTDAHRFYDREGMTMAGLYFVMQVAPD